MMHKFLLFFLYSSLVTFLSVTHSFAKEDEWQIDDFDSFIVASVPGEVVHGDKLRFALKKESCDKLNILFSFLTYKNPKEIKRLEGMTIPIKINQEEILGAAEIVLVQPAFNNMAYFVMLSAPKTYDLFDFSKSLMREYNSDNKFSIELVNGDDFRVKKYFDISLNKWNLDMYPEKINETYERCVKNNFKDIETDLSFL
jgi:hypothetical protein